MLNKELFDIELSRLTDGNKFSDNKTNIKASFKVVKPFDLPTLYLYRMVNFWSKLIASEPCIIPLGDVELLKLNPNSALYSPYLFLWGLLINEKDNSYSYYSDCKVIFLDREDQELKELWYSVNNYRSLLDLYLSREFIIYRTAFTNLFNQKPFVNAINKKLELINPEDINNPLYRIKQ